MRVIVTGDYKHPVLLSSTEATAVLIETDDGKPTVIFKMLPNGKGWLRLTEGEDKNFSEVARQLELI